MRLVFAAAAMALLAGCSTSGNFQTRPVGVGGGPNALKRAPCACNEKTQPVGLPDFLLESANIHKKAAA